MSNSHQSYTFQLFMNHHTASKRHRGFAEEVCRRTKNITVEYFDWQLIGWHVTAAGEDRQYCINGRRLR